MSKVLMLKVVKNKRTGQAIVSIPKKKFGGFVPEFVGVIKKDLFYKGGQKRK